MQRTRLMTVARVMQTMRLFWVGSRGVSLLGCGGVNGEVGRAYDVEVFGGGFGRACWAGLGLVVFFSSALFFAWVLRGRLAVVGEDGAACTGTEPYPEIEGEEEEVFIDVWKVIALLYAEGIYPSSITKQCANVLFEGW